MLDKTLYKVLDLPIACKHADETLFTDLCMGHLWALNHRALVVSGFSGACRVTTLNADGEGASLMFDAKKCENMAQPHRFTWHRQSSHLCWRQALRTFS